MIFRLIYDISIHLYLLATLPRVFYHWKKYKNNFLQRLGARFPKIDKTGKQLIWIHAVSLGETKAIAPLVKRLKKEIESPLIILSTSTETGYHEGLKNVPEADFHVFLPLDLSYIIRPILKKVQPDAIILTETDFWYHFQDQAKKIGAKIYLINGKISERSYRKHKNFPFLTKKLLMPVDHFYLQGELYKSRFEQLKIPHSKLTITGNIKLDTELEKTDDALLKAKLALRDEPVLTLGSTHHPEEALWIQALKQIWREVPKLKVLIVPRHPERFSEVAKLLTAEQIPFSRWSEMGDFTEHSVLLVDAMGVLRACYQISTIAFVGGSLTPKVGGHNILEPAFYGKPVLFGPHMHSQPDLLDLVKTHHSGLQITSETMISTLHELLTSPGLCQKFGERGLALTQKSKGSLNHTFCLLQKQLKC